MFNIISSIIQENILLISLILNFLYIFILATKNKKLLIYNLTIIFKINYLLYKFMIKFLSKNIFI